MEEWQDIADAAIEAGAQAVIEIKNGDIQDPNSHIHVEWEWQP